MQTFKTITLLAALTCTLFSCASDSSTKTSQNDSLPAVAKVDDAAAGTIVFFGNSLTAGYGLDPSEAFPAIIQQKIDSAGSKYKVINAGVSGETTAGGLGRIAWILRQPLDIFVLELGGNDGLRGIPPTETRKNLQGIIDAVRQKYPAACIILAGMQTPPNMGQAYATDFTKIYPDLAKQNKITLIPFLLEGVGGDEKLNQADGIHPTVAGHKIVAATVWKSLESLL